MEKTEFEGTLVLEKLNEIDRVDDFFEAIDSDNFLLVKTIMQEAGLDSETITMVLKKMEEADGEH